MSLRLEPLSMKYVTEVQRHASDPEVAQYTLLPEPYPENGAAQFIGWTTDEANKHQEFPYAILVDEQFVGVIGITRIDWQTRCGEIGYWLGQPFWGKGYATEAVRQMTQIGFEVVALDRLVAVILKRNAASVRVVEKAGYHFVGEVIEKYEKFLGETSLEYEAVRQR
jgi:RimJ/RimL family protein N-acetyltransferase